MNQMESAALLNAGQMPDSIFPPLWTEYRSALLRLESQSSEHRDLGQRTISLIFHAKRVLREDEFAQAMLMHVTRHQRQRVDLQLLDEAVLTSQGLVRRVVCTDGESVIDFVDAEVRRYLVSHLEQLSWLKGSRDTLARCCIVSMQNQVVAWRPSNYIQRQFDAETDITANLDCSSFFRYAAVYWSDHAVEAERQDITCSLALALQDSNFVRNAIVCLIPQLRPDEFPRVTEGTKLHWGGVQIAAYYGLDKVMAQIIFPNRPYFVAKAFEPSIHKARTSPLYIAVQRAHLRTVNTLMNGRIACTQTQWTNQVRVAVRAAARNGYTKLVRSLLTYAAEADFIVATPDLFRHAALLSAQKAGLDAMKDMILRAYPDLKSDAVKSDHASWPARRSKQLRQLRKLAAAGDDVNRYPGSEYTPLQIAIGANSLEVVHLLVAHGADVNLTQENLPSPLGMAACTGQSQIVKFLLDQGATTSNSTVKSAMVPKRGHYPARGHASGEENEALYLLLGRQKSKSDELADLQVIYKDCYSINHVWLTETTRRVVQRLSLEKDYAGFKALLAATDDIKVEWPAPAKCPTLARLWIPGEKIYIRLDRNEYYEFVGSNLSNHKWEIRQDQWYRGKSRAGTRSSPTTNQRSSAQVSKPGPQSSQQQIAEVSPAKGRSHTPVDDQDQNNIDEKSAAQESFTESNWKFSVGSMLEWLLSLFGRRPVKQDYKNEKTQ